MARSAMGVARPKTVPSWLVWILLSVLGAVAGALAAWQLRSLVSGRSGPGDLGQSVAYVATTLSVLISSGAQWLVLRRYRIDAYWWVPASIVANLVSVTLIVPPVFNFFYQQSPMSPPIGTVMLAGATALAAAGLLVGLAQWLVLRSSARNLAWLWVAATMLGGGLAGVLTTALSSQLLGLPSFATISLVAATGALLTSACQAPVVVRIVR